MDVGAVVVGDDGVGIDEEIEREGCGGRKEVGEEVIEGREVTKEGRPVILAVGEEGADRVYDEYG